MGTGTGLKRIGLSAVAAVAGWVCSESEARAHFHLDAPPASTMQDTLGDPQKPKSATDQCPDGTATNLMTQVAAGGKVTVKITETVPHGGHYRISFAAKEADFAFPNTPGVTNNQCPATTT